METAYYFLADNFCSYCFFDRRVSFDDANECIQFVAEINSLPWMHSEAVISEALSVDELTLPGITYEDDHMPQIGPTRLIPELSERLIRRAERLASDQHTQARMSLTDMRC